MGYTTEFEGRLTFDKPLSQEQVSYIQAFNRSRRMKRRPTHEILSEDPTRLAVGLPPGADCGYYVGNSSYTDHSVVDGNKPPAGQPGLWCKWTVSDDGTILEWDGVEKFYDYVEWLEYLISHFFSPWGRSLSGEIRWYGEDRTDIGAIVVENNVVKVREGLGLLNPAGSEDAKYSDRLDPDKQISEEEWIASVLFDYGRECGDAGITEELAAELGRKILAHVLRTFRPDLFG